MPDVTLGKQFDRIFQVASGTRFLNREGLGNEVPFFIQPYQPADQREVYRNIAELEKRLRAAGITPVMLSVYDIVLDVLRETDRFEAVAAMEPRMKKHEGRRSFLSEIKKFVGPDHGKHVVAMIRRLLDETPGHSLAIMYRLGEAYPYLRTHDLLNNLHSVISDVPLLVFFPGEYVSSDERGFYLSLFGRFNGEYYRAFKLDDYIKRSTSRG